MNAGNREPGTGSRLKEADLDASVREAVEPGSTDFRRAEREWSG